MEIIGRQVSERLENIFRRVNEIADKHGKQIVFKHTSEHPNPLLHSVRGVHCTDPVDSGKSVVYLNNGLSDNELELVAAHELCHLLANDQGFGYKYGLTRKVSGHQLDLWEILAISISCCFTHLTVQKLTQEFGYIIRDFDTCILNEVRDDLKQGKKIGTASVAQNAVLHISMVYQEKYSLSTLDIKELEDLYDKRDKRILELSRKVQPAIPNVDLFSVNGCFEATIAVRDAIGLNIRINLASCIHFFNRETGLSG